MGATQTLASYIVNAKYEKFPPEVVARAKLLIQDTIGCAMGGAQTDLGQRHIAIAKELGGKPQSTLVGGDGAKISPIFAAQANTELGNTLDFDDIDWLSLTHPASPIIFSALALGETVNASGRDIISAVIVGYDVGLRVARAIRSIVKRPDGIDEVLSNPSYIVFGSVAAAASILKLDAAAIENALGLAGSTPVNRGQSRVHLGPETGHPYVDNKYDMGVYALIGVFSSLRARQIAGPKGMLDGDRFWTRVCATSYEPSELTKGLGQEYRIMETSFKAVTFCGCTQAPVTAVLEALKGERINPMEVEEIKLTGIPKLEFTTWKDMVEAEFSTPCAVAVAFMGDRFGPELFSSGRYQEADVLALASKVKFVDDPKAREVALKTGEWMCTAEIRTRDGKVRRAHIDSVKGTRANPMSEVELLQKFLGNTEGILGKQARKFWEALSELEKASKISSLASYWGKAKAGEMLALEKNVID